MKTITIDLFSNDIDKAIKEIYEYSKSIENKMNILRQRLADEIANEASTNFSGAVVDDVINGSVKRAEVTVSVNEIGTISVVVADSSDAVDSDDNSEEVYECPECGAAITIDMTTCPNCGVGLSFEEEE